MQLSLKFFFSSEDIVLVDVLNETVGFGLIQADRLFTKTLDREGRCELSLYRKLYMDIANSFRMSETRLIAKA